MKQEPDTKPPLQVLDCVMDLLFFYGIRASVATVLVHGRFWLFVDGRGEEMVENAMRMKHTGCVEC